MKTLIRAIVVVCAMGTAHAQQPPPSGPTKLIVKATEAPTIPVALWMENGKPAIARGPEAANAPATATRVRTTIYNMGGPNFRKVVFPKGATFSPPGGPYDTLVYVMRGRMKVTMGDITGDVGPGDTVRELAGVLTVFEVLDEVEVLETNVPAQAPPAPLPPQ